MRSLAILGSASMLVLMSTTEGGAATLCVDPDDGGCFATIQAAVDAASPGDTISIREKADGSAYNEAVTIATEDLTITGEDAAPTFRSVAQTIQFSGLRTVDLADPDVGLWLDNYPDAQDFLDAVATLEDFIQDEVLIDQCPPVIVELCDAPATEPGRCGTDADPNAFPVDVFTVEVPGTTFADLTIRHGGRGIGLGVDVADTTVERVCFRNNNNAVESIDDAINDRTTIRQSFIDGASRFEGFDIQGDDAVIERNLLLNFEGINIEGDDYRVSFNAASVTTDDECFDLDGENGVLSYNIGLDCDGALALRGGVDTTVLGNLFQGVPDDDEAIDGDDVPESNTAPDRGNRRTIIKNNIIRLVSDDGVVFGASDGVFEGNLLERAGNDRAEAGLELRGNDNEVLFNLIRFSSGRAITIESFFDATLGQDVPSSGNLIRGNLLTRNHTSGVHLPPAVDFGSGPTPQADDTTIDANIITLNDGEGVSIPEGDGDPPNQPAATDTTLTDNTFRSNRTDICNESATTVDGGGNGPFTGGLATDCTVEPGLDF